MRGRGRVVCIDLMGGICIGEKEIHLQFGLTCSRNFLVKLQYWQYIAINFYLLHTQEHCHLFIGRKKEWDVGSYASPGAPSICPHSHGFFFAGHVTFWQKTLAACHDCNFNIFCAAPSGHTFGMRHYVLF